MATTQLVINIIANATQTTRAINNVNSQVQNMSSSINRSSNNSSNAVNNLGNSFLKTGLKTMAVIAGVETIGAALGRITNAGIEFIKTIDDSRAAFKVMANGSQDEADKLLSKVVNLARTSPLSTQEVVKGAQTLMGFGVEIDKVESKLTQLGDIARGNDDRFSRLVLAFGQVTAAGRLMGQETLQFINAGFNPLAEMSKVLAKELGGVASDYMPKLKKAMEEGQISVQAVANAMKLATSEGGIFNGMLEEMSKTFSGQVNIFKDNALILIAGALKPITDFLTNVLLPTASAVMEIMIASFNSLGIPLESIAEKQNRMAKESEDAAKSQKKLTKGVEDTDKALQSNLQSFDQLHVLQKETKKDAKNGGLKDLEKITQDAADKAKKSKLIETVDKIKESVSRFANDIGLSKLSESFKKLWKALEPFAGYVGDAIKWFLDNVVLPMAKIVIGTALPLYLDNLTKAINVLNEAVGFAKNNLTWLWKEYLEPLANWSGNKVSEGLKAIGIELKNIQGESTLEKISKVLLGTLQLTATALIAFAKFSIFGLINVAINALNLLIEQINKLPGIQIEPFEIIDMGTLKTLEDTLARANEDRDKMINGSNKPLNLPYYKPYGTPTTPSTNSFMGAQNIATTEERSVSDIAKEVIEAQKKLNTSGVTTQNISLNIDGRVFARLVAPLLNEENRRVGNMAISP